MVFCLCMGPARPICCVWLDWLARWSNRLVPVRSQILVVYLILMSTSRFMTSRWFLFTYSSIPNVESCWEKNLCSDMVSCLFMIRCVLMPRKSIAGDGPWVDLGEVDVWMITISCRMLRLKNNVRGGEDYIWHTRGIVCVWKTESNLEVVQI